MTRTRLFAGAAGTVGAAVAAATSAKLFTDHRRKARILRRGDEIAFGSLHSPRRWVTATDGVRLAVEVDDGPVDGPTVIFVHGWMCSLDSWHFQRAALRGKVAMVFYDQRSHGASGRSPAARSTIEQLSCDLRSVVEECAPAGDIVLVGHSMGGMTIMGLADHFPDMLRDRVKGIVLLATGAGQLMRGNSTLVRLRPLIARTSILLDAGRTFNSYAVVRRLGLGPHADERYISMTEEMVLKNRSYVLLDFYPMLMSLDLYAALETIAVDHVVVVGGTKDLMTPLRHGRKLAELIEGAELIELEGAGHMVMFEENEKVTDVIAEVVDAIS